MPKANAAGGKARCGRCGVAAAVAVAVVAVLLLSADRILGAHRMTDEAIATAAAAGSQARRGNLTAVVIGATGAIGKYVVAELLQRPQVWSKVTTIVRRPWAPPADVTGIDAKEAEASGRLVQHVVDLHALAGRTDLVAGHTHAFSALGTTRRDAGSAEAFRALDFGVNTAFAQLCKTAGVEHFSLVSSQGANADSWFLYMQVKGQTDEAVRALGFPVSHIYRPGLLDRGADNRLVEKISKLVVTAIPVQTVAAAIVNDAERALAAEGRNSHAISENDAIYRSAALGPATPPPPAAVAVAAPAAGSETSGAAAGSA